MADGPDNPRSLKVSEDGGEDQVLSGTYDQSTGEKLSSLQYARQEEDRYYGFVADQARSGKSLGYDKSTGRVFEYVEKTASGNSLDDFFGEGDAVAGEGIGSSKNYNTEAALTAQSYFDSWQSAQRDLERDADDAKAAKAAGGAARSYLSTETDKTKEIQRQYKDFEDRASLLYDLMGDEQDFAMAADTQNAKNAAARAEGLLLPGRGLSYSPYVMGGALSQILSPSLSDYVRPDYRLNQAVGLPGAQGFDDPDYGPDGLPMFAYGTGQSGQWAPGYVPTAGLPGQLPKQDYPTWVASAVDRILFNLRDGNNGNDGRPGDWNDAQFGDWNRLVELAQYPAGVPQSAEIALYDYVQKSQAADDLAYSLGLGTRPSSSATDYTENLTPSEKLAREQFEYTKQQNALKMALGGSSSRGSKISSSSTRSSSSGGGVST